jgi:hypothetical protein
VSAAAQSSPQPRELYVIGPYYDRNERKFRFACPACSRSPAAGTECTAGWLVGQRLIGDDVCCDCFETYPYPAAKFPDKQMHERRYFHYHAIARLLGATGQGHGDELPPCVRDRIEQMYGSSEVGFKPRPA